MSRIPHPPQSLNPSSWVVSRFEDGGYIPVEAMDVDVADVWRHACVLVPRVRKQLVIPAERPRIYGFFGSWCPLLVFLDKTTLCLAVDAIVEEKPVLRSLAVGRGQQKPLRSQDLG